MANPIIIIGVMSLVIFVLPPSPVNIPVSGTGISSSSSSSLMGVKYPCREWIVISCAAFRVIETRRWSGSVVSNSSRFRVLPSAVKYCSVAEALGI